MYEENRLILNEVFVSHCSRPLLDVAGAVRMQLQRLRSGVRPGARIAIAVGSRGIANLALIVRETVSALKAWGCVPFIVPAMGSHGGATAEGQEAILASYGVTEAQVGAPVRSSMETVRLGCVWGTDVQVYMDRLAYESDGVIAINRVKAHTDFHGLHESGICKILVIGLGKHAQALSCHAYLSKGLKDYIPKVAQMVIASGKIIGAVGIVEDGYDQTSEISAAPAEEILEMDSQLLQRAKERMPRLPFEQCDILLVDRMGKNISGTGMDTNILGRTRIQNQPDEKPEITTVCVFNLTPEGHGNALGVGLADLIPQRLLEQIDWDSTYQNVLTSRFLQRGFLPVVRPTDRDVVEAAYAVCGVPDRRKVRLAYIRDTLSLSRMYVSDAALKTLCGRTDIQITGTVEVKFCEDGTLLSPFEK